MASLSKTAILPSAFRSLANIGLLSFLYPTIILPSLLFKSIISLDKHRIAITSDATVISNLSILGTRPFSPERPVLTTLNWRSLRSRQRFQTTRSN